LKTHLETVTQLKEVKLGRDLAFSGFPACRFYLAGVSDELQDNAPTYLRTYKFAVEVFQETTVKTKANAEADWQDAVDAVMDKLNAQWNLSGNAEDSKMEMGNVAQVETPQGPAVFIQIILSVRTLIQ
jgi:hypothetical protein